MKHKWLTILILGSLLFASFGSVLAQENQPPGAQQNSEGNWFMTEDISGNLAMLATGGPDVNGYIWDDSEPFNWIDASGGIDTGMSGYGEGVGPIPLPFAFPFYKNPYTQVYISAYGYLTFSSPNIWWDQGELPHPDAPNNVIAPFWTPTYIGTGSWVRYLSGGTAPNRYFVVEWHDVKGGDPLDTIGRDETYRFEVVLYENGDSIFQYQVLDYDMTDGVWCSSSGIENSTGQIGLAYYDICEDIAVAGTAVRFERTTFTDVPDDNWAADWIYRLYSAGITGGCSASPLAYCPESSVTRAQMAIFLEKGMNGSSFSPPNVAPTFGDTVGHWAEDWIEALKNDGVTSGCGAGNYCPESNVTRAQMAVFLLKAKYGASYTPPSVGATTGFTDVTTAYWAAAWIKQLAAEGITGGCGTNLYCPENPVTRAQMAVFLVKTFNLP